MNAKTGGLPKWVPGTIVLGFLVAIFLIAAILVVLDQKPGTLAIEIGLLVVLMSMLGTAARPGLAQLFGIEEATTEISLMHGMFAISVTGLALVVLGFLNLMGVVPWWKPYI